MGTTERQQPTTRQVEKFPTEWAMGYEEERDNQRQGRPSGDAPRKHRVEQANSYAVPGRAGPACRKAGAGSV
jgi:hypothetical protein